MRKKKDYTYEYCLLKAKNYDSIIAWYKGDVSSYAYALKLGWVDRILNECGIERLRKKKQTRTYSDIVSIAKSYNSFKEWRTNNINSYRYAVKKNWLDMILNVVDYKKQEITYTFEECLADAKNYGDYKSWRSKSKLYKYCLKNNMVDRVLDFVGFAKYAREANKKEWWFNI